MTNKPFIWINPVPENLRFIQDDYLDIITMQFDSCLGDIVFELTDIWDYMKEYHAIKEYQNLKEHLYLVSNADQIYINSDQNRVLRFIFRYRNLNQATLMKLSLIPKSFLICK